MSQLLDCARRRIVLKVNHSSYLKLNCKLLAFTLLIIGVCAHAQDHQIHLRHGTIFTPPKAEAVAAAKTSPVATTNSASKLFLVQLEKTPDVAMLNQLRAAGVHLIKYVPDDAFIARMKNVSPDTIRGLSSVRWVGDYRPEYKIHPRLESEVAAQKQKNTSVAVNILFSPDASKQEIARAHALLARIQHENHLPQGTVVRADISADKLNALAQSDATLWIEPAPKRKLYDETASKLVGGDDGAVATPTVTQQEGFDGSGVTVCVADTGLDTGNTNTMHPDLFGRVTGFQPYGDLLDGSDGYGHGTHCAGIIAGNAATGETDPDSGALYGLGIAPGADLFIERIFGDNAEEADPFPSDETLTRDAVRHGAKIGSNSWGNDTQGEYDLDAMQFDALVRDADSETPGDQPYVLEFSAGNAGPASQTIGSPACAKNVIATGASENVPNTLALTYGLYADGADTMADFSSRGPCADGRIKPDLVAPGTWIASAASSAAQDLANTSWTVIDGYYVYMGGTSMSGPYAAGAAAVFMQFYEQTHTNAIPSPALVKAALINSADELDESDGGPAPVPNNDEGWGRVTLTNIITTNVATAPRYYDYVDQSVLLTNSQVYTEHIFVQGADQPLKVTLAYTDVPGFPGAIPALVNDLDLEVVAPDGTLYRGNQFGAGESIPNPPNSDKLNNVEGVYLSNPVPGDYIVRVRASRIVQDAITNTLAVDQDFALVSSGDLVRPGTGLLLLDRSSYTAPDSMHISVLDVGRAGDATVNVVVTNLTSHQSVGSTLQAVGNYGVFTGAVETVTGTAGPVQIQIANGDSLEAEYVDSHGFKRVATATADLVPPVVNSVSSSTDVGVLTITWQTSEPATSIVLYGTNSANLNLGVTNLALVTNHSVKLTGLIAGKTYYYEIVSSDAAGNTATSNNGGSNYTFTGVTTPTVLMVDDYDTPAEQSNGSTVIPDGAYTNVLSAAGVSFGFWKVTQRGAPTLDDLKPFPVVIWRTTDDAVNYGGYDDFGQPDPSATNNTLTAQQQYMIQSYLNGGGAFFMASMEILSRLGDVPFRRNVLQVGGFEQNTDPLGVCPDCDEDHGVPAFFGSPGSIANGMSVNLDYSNYPSFDFGDGYEFGPDFSDTFTPASDASAVTFESVSGRACGMSYPKIGVDSPGRVVFLSFPFDCVPTSGTVPNNAVTLMRNIINFLAPGANGVGMVFLDSSVYTTNETVTVEVGDSDLAGTGHAQVSFVASSRTNQVIVDLQEMAHPGLFRGQLTLVNGSASAGQLQVNNGDVITASYFDASNGSNVTATASIDTEPPVISQVASTTDYYNARVTWNTSKPADSAVQYNGLPQPPANSAYDSALVTNHSITVSGLLANRIYYYQVVSRDQAGNTVVDDNNGNYYTFQTLKAPAPPWSDDLESGSNSWTVVPDPDYGSDYNWTLGKPNNGLVTSAHSGSNVWSSDLNGQSPGFIASSYLVAPVIDLSGLSHATLTFWDCYDFSQAPQEQGQILISTNDSAPLSSLPVLKDYSGDSTYDWQLETVDLTPYVGKTIQVVWQYASVFGGSDYYGWNVDDVSITGVVAGGNVSITKNLGQGTWSLSSLSPIGLVPVQSGTSASVTVSNLPADDYVVQFSDVPFYQTPSTQTNTLTIGGTANFVGNYTFPDANSNGISDGYEWSYFGSVSTNRTQLVDSDGDGMTDYAEFIAGTNPTNAASNFRFLSTSVQTNGVVNLQFSTVPGRLYQLEPSSDLKTWQTNATWMQATSSSMSFSATNTEQKAQFYRVQVRP